MLFPETLTDYSGMKEYYFKRSDWFFGPLAFASLINLFDTLLKGKKHFVSLGLEYPIHNSIGLILFLLAIKIKKEWYHAALGISLILYTLIWIVKKSFFE